MLYYIISYYITLLYYIILYYTGTCLSLISSTIPEFSRVHEVLPSEFYGR